MGMGMKYDVKALVNDIKRVEHEIRKVKSVLRAPWTREMGAEQVALENLRYNATMLYTLRADNRGKKHCHNWSIDQFPQTAVRNYRLTRVRVLGFEDDLTRVQISS